MGCACAWLADGVARCWGLDGRGQLGNGKTSNATIPVTVSDVEPQTKIVFPSAGAHLSGNVMYWAASIVDVALCGGELAFTSEDRCVRAEHCTPPEGCAVPTTLPANPTARRARPPTRRR